MGQTPKVDAAQSVIDQVGGVLFIPRLQGTPNYPLLGLLKIFERAHLIRLPQRVRPHLRGNFAKDERPAFPRAESIAQYRAIDCQTPFQMVYTLLNPLIVLHFK